MSDRLPDSPSRLDELEIRIAHQDRTIAELNDTVAAQWLEIDTLGRQLQRLVDEVANLQPSRDATEPPPPHY